MVPPLYYFEVFLETDPKNFTKAPLAPIYTNFEGGARAEKTRFFLSKFSNASKNAFLVLFFQNFASGAEILAKTGSFYSAHSALGYLEKSI